MLSPTAALKQAEQEQNIHKHPLQLFALFAALAIMKQWKVVKYAQNVQGQEMCTDTVSRILCE